MDYNAGGGLDYLYFTIIVSSCLHVGHSKVRLSKPGVCGETRASHIGVRQVGQGGRSITTEGRAVLLKNCMLRSSCHSQGARHLSVTDA
jgi:hypothetical protein